jgi:protein SCO1/2
VTATPWYKSPYLWCFVVGCLTLTALRPFLRHTPEPPPVLGQAPAFRMVDQQGRAFGSEDLKGQVYIANFFFTRCASVCPKLMHQTRTLQDRFAREHEEGIHLVSISVDPDNDTPANLASYAEQIGVDSRRWALLSGEKDRLKQVLEGGFKVPLGEPETLSGTTLDIAHSGKLVLVDQQGGIRGYYDIDPTGLDEVFFRAQHVRDQK